jgi:hypothetical protein
MALSMWTGASDPFFNQMERSMDNAFNRAFGGRGMITDIMGMPTTGTDLFRNVGVSMHPVDIIETNDSFNVTCDAPGEWRRMLLGQDAAGLQACCTAACCCLLAFTGLISLAYIHGWSTAVHDQYACKVPPSASCSSGSTCCPRLVAGSMQLSRSLVLASSLWLASTHT